ncbi:hypothetical protein Bca4012_008586 [Brassica carinata]
MIVSGIIGTISTDEVLTVVPVKLVSSGTVFVSDEVMIVSSVVASILMDSKLLASAPPTSRSRFFLLRKKVRRCQPLCVFESVKCCKRGKMGREKSPGLKILWVWTIGTAAILVASVVRTRMHDMETMMNQEQAPKQNQNVAASRSVLTDETVLPESDREIAKELK